MIGKSDPVKLVTIHTKSVRSCGGADGPVGNTGIVLGAHNANAWTGKKAVIKNKRTRVEVLTKINIG